MSITINPSFGLDSPSKNRREMLFEKPMTPSDVGKLNRLVIPKQYAEKYLLPLRDGSGESLLSFEDDFGKIWRFKYSYWTSSQSYVLTKGWRRYVKEKGLMAGDIVSFQREQCSCDNRLFITWRTRPHNVDLLRHVTPKYDNNAGTGDQLYRSRTAYCPLRSMMKLSHRSSYSAGGDNKIDIPNNNSPRRLRLFGVNMEFGRDDQFRFSI